MSDHPKAIVVATNDTGEQARTTARSAMAAGGLPCRVIDIDGGYQPVGDEQVIDFVELARSCDAGAEVRDAAATLEPSELSFYAGVLGTEVALAEGASGVVLLGAGVVVLGDLRSLAASAAGTTAVLPRLDGSLLGHAGLSRALVTHAVEFGAVNEPKAEGTLFTRSMVVFGQAARVEVLRRLAADWRYALTALDSFAAATAATVLPDAPTLVSPWRCAPDAALDRAPDGRLQLDGTPVTAIDLTRFDPEKPWILEPSDDLVRPSVLISEHPVLLDVVTATAADWRTDGEQGDDLGDDRDGSVPPRLLFDRILRQEARRASLIGGEVPDLLGAVDETATRETIEEWALAMVPPTHPRPVARYLAGVRALRRDLQEAFVHVPGNGSTRLARWALEFGVKARGVDHDLVRRAGEATLAAQPTAVKRGRRPEGVNLVGYLAAELGLGQSARLVDAALHAAGEPTSTFDVSRRLPHRASAAYRVSEPVLYDTTLLCVNGAETPEVLKQIGTVANGTRRIGMWYWELEDFPSSHGTGFHVVDEVWAATDFIRDAIASKSPGVPVRTVVPPLPQREGEAPELPTRFGLDPARPFFLFTFDFMSYAGRKNPYGLVEAFAKAFPEPTPDGPQLVIKTINGDKRSTDAERLRLQMASREDLILIEEYLPNHERHVLVAHCAAYVSLHKAEGLGLTLAEAMAWGKPVIATRYGGVVQFMDDENSLLVGWTPGVIPEHMGPYEKGLRWAEPDLDEAAAMMRRVIEDPAHAAAIGERAARDIRELHNIEVAGAHMREALTDARAARAAERAEQRAARQREQAATAGAAAPGKRPLLRRVASRARRELAGARHRFDAKR